LDILLSQETNLPVHVAEDAISCVAIGTGKALDQMAIIRQTKKKGIKRLR
jgi:rod shape-determining protein MreB